MAPQRAQPRHRVSWSHRPELTQAAHRASLGFTRSLQSMTKTTSTFKVQIFLFFFFKLKRPKSLVTASFLQTTISELQQAGYNLESSRKTTKYVLRNGCK